jgi:hypothetical protein
VSRRKVRPVPRAFIEPPPSGPSPANFASTLRGATLAAREALLFPPLPEGDGLAAAYPADGGITGNAAVIFADTFESYTTTSQLTSSGNWNNYFQAGNTLIDTAQAFSGTRSLRLRMPQSGSEVSNAVVKNIADQDTLFVRCYTRFAANYAGFNPGGHNGIAITGRYTGPGQGPSASFAAILWEAVNYGDAAEPGKYRLYIYHPEQNDAYGENWYPSGRTTNGDGPDGGFGPNFVARPEIVPPRGQWVCSELMVKLNTPGQRDGRVAVWQDGVLVADWQNVRFRDSTAVRLDRVEFQNGSQASSQINDKWYDNIVIATQYVGPMAPAVVDGTPPSQVTGLSATALSSSSISLTWNDATDNVGVTSYEVQRATDAGFTANLWQQDVGNVTSYPATGLGASTTYHFRVRARDAAGNFGAWSASANATTSAASVGGTITAASASLADVQAAVNAAQDGDTVLIPNGTATWNGGITTSKQIIIRAQNITPTSGGTMTRNVTITNASSGTPLFTFNTGNSHHGGVGGIRFNAGGTTAPYIRLEGTGSKVPLIWDCAFQNNSRFGSAEAVGVIVWLCTGGVAWNIRIDGSSFPASGSDVGPDIAGMCIHFKSPRAWTTASTLGSLDTNGDQNVYIEDSTFHLTQSNDVDDRGRVVVRYCTLNGSPWITHGFTSSWGGRFIEFYNNTFSSSTQPRNLAGRYTWFRAGHGVFTDNVANNATTGDYSQPSLFQCAIESGTNNMSWDGSSWPKPRQAGCGHNGSAYVSDPIYFWNNSGPRASSVGGSGSTPGANIGRDLITSGAAKPGYSKYTYPHPFRSAV